MAEERNHTSRMIRDMKKHGYRPGKFGRIPYLENARKNGGFSEYLLSSDADAEEAEKRGAPEQAVKLIRTYPHIGGFRSGFDDAWALERHMLLVDTIGTPGYERMFTSPANDCFNLSDVDMYDRCMTVPCDDPVKALMTVGAEKMMDLFISLLTGVSLKAYHTNVGNIMAMALDVAVRAPEWFDEYCSIVEEARDGTWPEGVPITRKTIMECVGLPKAFIIESARAQTSTITTADYRQTVQKIIDDSGKVMLARTGDFVRDLPASRREEAIRLMQTLASKPKDMMRILGFEEDGGILGKTAGSKPAVMLRMLETAVKAGDDGLYRWAVFRACERRLDTESFISWHHTLADEAFDYVSSGVVPSTLTYHYGTWTNVCTRDGEYPQERTTPRIKAAFRLLETIPKTLEGFMRIVTSYPGPRILHVNDYVGLEMNKMS